MDAYTFFKSNDKARIEQVAKKAGTTPANLMQLSLYGGACSWRLAKRLESASDGEMTCDEILAQKELEASKAS